MPYIDYDPTQLQHNEVTHHVPTTQSPDDLSVLSNKRPAPTPPNHDSGPSHVADDVIAVQANGASAACSRSSSRSSGFDEISSAVTEFSLLPVAVAHALDDKPEMTSSEKADDDQADMSCEDRTTKKEDNEVDSLDTIKTGADNHDNDTKTDSEPQQTASDDQQESCSSQVEEEKAETDARLEEISRQIECMSERFNELFARVKASETSEVRRSMTSLTDAADTRYISSSSSRGQCSTPLMTSDKDPTRQSPSTRVTPRNTAYRQWLIAKNGLAPDTDVNRTREPITATDDVAMTTNDAIFKHVTAVSAPIGQQTGDDVSVPAVENRPDVTTTECDDVMKCASTDDMTSEIHEFQSKEAVANDALIDSKTNKVNMWSVDAGKADRVSELHRDLQTTFRSNTYRQELSEECLTLKCHQKNVPLPMSSRSFDELNVGYDENSIRSNSGHPSQSQPPSLSAQPDDVFVEDITTTPTRSLGRHPKLTSTSRRLLPAVPSATYTRSMSPQPSDVFADSDPPWRAWSSATRTTRLRPAASFESVPRSTLIRRRSRLLSLFLQ